jgi:hypothetical protein
VRARAARRRRQRSGARIAARGGAKGVQACCASLRALHAARASRARAFMSGSRRVRVGVGRGGGDALRRAVARQ